MQIGAMNHPASEVRNELKWIVELGFDFVDLTLEPPLANARHQDIEEIRKQIEDAGLGVVGHTAYYLPLCSPFEGLRRAAVEELRICLEAFSKLGASWMNLHPDGKAPFLNRDYVIRRNLETIYDLLPTARELGVGLMIENLPGAFNDVHQLRELLDSVPELGFHLDIGHANLQVDQNTTPELLAAYGSRLRHVHLHDNKGDRADLHLPLGAGTVDVARHVHSLQAAGYDDTITLEVFSPDRRHLEYSRDLLRRIWDEQAQARTS